MTSAVVLGGIVSAAVWWYPDRVYNGGSDAAQTEQKPEPSDHPVPGEQGSGPKETGSSGTSAPGTALGGGSEGTKPAADPQRGGAPDAANGDVSMAFVGDVLLADRVEVLMKQNGYDYPYSKVKDLLQKADVAVANLETPVTERGTKQIKEYAYRSSPQALPALKEAGIDLVNLANNHVMDYGPEGLLDTIAHLDRNGIQHMGAGKDAAEAFQPVVVEKKGVKIAFLGFSRVVPNHSWKAGVNHPGVADTYNYTLPVEAVKKAKTQADLAVVFTHWGVERKEKPESYQTELAHRYIDAGADLIVASHPHVLQGLEQYHGKWIAYSLGNFIFTTNDVPQTWDTVIMEAACSKEGQCGLHLIPINNKWAKPEPMPPEQGLKLFERLSAISANVKVEPDGTVTSTAGTAAGTSSR
jgi:hypothetical protein